MKRLMHLCFTSKQEVLCRCERDYQMMVSRIAHSAVCNDCNIWAYAVMSNHVHIILQTSKPSQFIRTLRSSYNQSFNYLYHRNGALGDANFFKLELDGPQHIVDAITYVLQNPWHHKVATNPLDYAFSSMYLYFRKENAVLSSLKNPEADISKSNRMVNRRATILSTLSYEGSGMVHPSSFVEVKMVENLFGSYNAFQYLVHRKNYKEWENEQKKDNKITPSVTMHSMEPILDSKELSIAETFNSKWMKETWMSDLDICTLIDRTYVPKFQKESYVGLSIWEREQIASEILSKHRHSTSIEQIKRCLGSL